LRSQVAWHTLFFVFFTYFSSLVPFQLLPPHLLGTLKQSQLMGRWLGLLSLVTLGHSRSSYWALRGTCQFLNPVSAFTLPCPQLQWTHCPHSEPWELMFSFWFHSTDF
jgi:hypothetical protein